MTLNLNYSQNLGSAFLNVASSNIGGNYPYIITATKLDENADENIASNDLLIWIWTLQKK